MNHRRRLAKCLGMTVVGMSVMLSLAVATPQIAFAQVASPKNKTPAQEKGDAGSNDDKPDVQAALAFVKEHHAEIVSLLELLRAMNPKQFEMAIKDTNRVRMKLEQLQAKDRAAYEVELASWKVQSQINLHVAKRVAVDHDFDGDVVLGELLESQRKLQIRILEIEKARLHKRMAQIDEQLDGANNHASEWLSSQRSKLSRKAATQGSKVKKKSETTESSQGVR